MIRNITTSLTNQIAQCWARLMATKLSQLLFLSITAELLIILFVVIEKGVVNALLCMFLFTLSLAILYLLQLDKLCRGLPFFGKFFISSMLLLLIVPILYFDVSAIVLPLVTTGIHPTSGSDVISHTRYLTPKDDFSLFIGIMLALDIFSKTGEYVYGKSPYFLIPRKYLSQNLTNEIIIPAYIRYPFYISVLIVIVSIVPPPQLYQLSPQLILALPIIAKVNGLAFILFFTSMILIACVKGLYQTIIRTTFYLEPTSNECLQ